MSASKGSNLNHKYIHININNPVIISTVDNAETSTLVSLDTDCRK